MQLLIKRYCLTDIEVMKTLKSHLFTVMFVYQFHERWQGRRKERRRFR